PSRGISWVLRPLNRVWRAHTPPFGGLRNPVNGEVRSRNTLLSGLKPHEIAGLEAAQQCIAVANFAIRGLEKSRENIECGGLTGAVRSDEADDFSVANREIEIGQSDEPAEIDRDVLDRKDHVLRCTARRHHGPPRDWELSAAIARAGLRVDEAQFAIQRSSAGTIPCGRTKTITIIKPP